MRDLPLIGCTIALLLVIAAFFYLVISSGDELTSFRANCSKAGGHIYEPGSTLWCLNNDGRILEVYP